MFADNDQCASHESDEDVLAHVTDSAAAYFSEAMPAAGVSPEVRGVIRIIQIIEVSLRMALPKNPGNERHVQDALAAVFRAASLEFSRESDSSAWSAKGYHPDFTFEQYKLAVEVKLCNSGERLNQIIDEINKILCPYKKRYKRILCVIYDSGGFIRDVHGFARDFTGIPDLHILIVKA